MNIFDLFAKASETLQYPKLSYPIDEHNKIVFSLAGAKAKVPGSINITDSKGYGIFWGRIIKDDVKKVLHIAWNPRTAIDKDFKDIVRAIAANPIGMGSLAGQKFSYCCFCSTQITTKESLAVGYGPICAEKWGLPWGQLILKELDSKNL